MTVHDAPLPNFDNPPVGEVALSVQFDTLKGFQAAHLGLFWAGLRNRYPQSLTQPPIEPVIETFEPKLVTQQRPAIRVELVNQLAPPRSWFLTESGSELIQVQRDRFVFNWRKIRPNDRYPRYEAYIRPQFLKEFGLFAQFAKDEGLGDLRVNQCEVTYINYIGSGTVWASHGEIGKVLRLWRTDPPDPVLPPCETVRLAMQYLITAADESAPLGRLHIDVQPALRIDDRAPILAMNLTARGAPLGTGVGGITQFMDLGRRYIVLAFKALTTPGMHKEWGYRG